MDCETCRHFTVVGLHDTGPRDQPFHTTDHHLDPINHGPSSWDQTPPSPSSTPLPPVLDDTRIDTLGGQSSVKKHDPKGLFHRVVNLILNIKKRKKRRRRVVSKHRRIQLRALGGPPYVSRSDGEATFVTFICN